MKTISYQEFRHETLTRYGLDETIKAMDEFMTQYPEEVGKAMFEFALREDGEPMVKLTEVGRKAWERYQERKKLQE